MRKRSAGSGRVVARSVARGSVKPAPDRRPSGTAAHAGHVLEGAAAAAALRTILDGEAVRCIHGFHAITAKRQLFIRFDVTSCPAEALRLALTQGLVSEKLESLPEFEQELLRALTLPKPDLPN